MVSIDTPAAIAAIPVALRPDVVENPQPLGWSCRVIEPYQGVARPSYGTKTATAGASNLAPGAKRFAFAHPCGKLRP